jgi:hypothetical protein
MLILKHTTSTQAHSTKTFWRVCQQVGRQIYEVLIEFAMQTS